jgi:ribose 5-phosphate isomerase RpiB
MNSSSGVVCATCRDVCDTVIGELSNETKVISSSAAQESLAANVSRQSG